MKKFLLIASIAFSAITLSALSQEKGFTRIFDGKSLKGWKSARSTGEGDWGPYRINEEEKAIHVYKGEEAGSTQTTDCLYTEKEYSSFILRLEYKWLEDRFAPREDHDRDAGLLFHVHGDLTKVWPYCMEMQIGETPGTRFGKQRYHTGDLFVLGGHLRCKTLRKGNRYDPKGEVVNGRSVGTALGVEKPKGEWNLMEIEVHGAKKAIFKLNGEVVLKLTDMEMKVGDEWLPLAKGRIALQAEWAELLYRNIEIKELAEDAKPETAK